jgi:FYVE/RhoGEF/PH domain-containing protein 5/6
MICQNMRSFGVYADEFDVPKVKELVPSVFMNIGDIAKLHGLMLDKMEESMVSVERMQSPDPEIFVVFDIPAFLGEYAPFLKMYYAYVANHEDALERLNAFRKQNEEFNRFLNVIERSQNQTLQSLLIMPVQRIPRYRLLMDRVVSLAKKAHLENERIDALKGVLSSIESIAGKLDTDMKMKEKRLMVIQLQEKMFRGKVELVTSSRFFVKMGVMKVNLRPHKKTSSFRPYQVILFNDLLVLATASRTRASLKISLPIEGMSLMEDENAPDGASRFMILHSTQEFPIVVSVESEEQKQEWMQEIQKYIENARRLMARPRNESA